MKGVYSSPDSVLGREVQQALFPDNTYGVDSGGDPVVIPELKFEEFQALPETRERRAGCSAPPARLIPAVGPATPQDFHARYYHPSNSRLWFYGDDDPQAFSRRIFPPHFPAWGSRASSPATRRRWRRS